MFALVPITCLLHDPSSAHGVGLWGVNIRETCSTHALGCWLLDGLGCIVALGKAAFMVAGRGWSRS